jgi:hypothetical protein
MSRIQIDGPEEVHLNMAEEDNAERDRLNDLAELRRANKQERKNDEKEKTAFAIVGGGLIIILLFGLWQTIWERPYDITFHPEGEQMRIERTHWIRKDGWMLLSRHYDIEQEEFGWCVWAAGKTGAERWQLVFSDDGETLMGTRAEWWRPF